MKIRNSILMLAVMFAVPAMAADLPVKAVQQPVYRTGLVYDWTGFFVGAEAGYGWGDSDGSLNVGKYNLAAKNSPTGGLFGLRVGAQKQFTNNLVLGVEAAFDWSNFEDSVGVSGLPGWFPTVTSKVKMDRFGTAQVTFGYAIDRWKPYVGVGVAWARSNETLSCCGGSIKGNDFDNVGWSITAGVDYAMYENWILNLSYTHADLGTANSSFNAFGNGTLGHPIDQKVDTVKAGVTYKFGSGL